MRCFFCSRPLKSPAIFFRGEPAGPKCAKAHNLFTGPARKHAKRQPARQATKIERDGRTIDMFEILGDGND